jgi:hypothetical protein
MLRMKEEEERENNMGTESSLPPEMIFLNWWYLD